LTWSIQRRSDPASRHRQAFYAGTTDNPTGARTTQAARNLFLRHANAHQKY
jgi:hypothetical protein